MTLRFLIKVLLIVYGLAIMGSSIMEVGHALLHQMQSTMHDHDHGHYHTLEDHHLEISADVQDTEADSSFTHNVGSYFLFFENCSLRLAPVTFRTIHPNPRLIVLLSRPFVPFVPPPVS